MRTISLGYHVPMNDAREYNSVLEHGVWAKGASAVHLKELLYMHALEASMLCMLKKYFKHSSIFISDWGYS